MASYTGRGRTEEFTVKDLAAFKEALEPFSYDLEVISGQRANTDPNLVYLICTGEVGDWAFYPNDVDDSDDDSVFIPDLVAPHLADGSIAVFQHVGNEKLRYLNAFATAVHPDGRQITVSLGDIDEMARTAFAESAQE